MGIQKTEAIILRIRDFRETSLLINFFTQDFGKLSGIIKGIRNDPQRYGGIPQVFAHSHIVFYEKQSKDLCLVTQCETKDVFQAIRHSLEKTSFANYFVELLDAVTQAFDKNARLYTLMLEALSALCKNLESWRIARLFEIRLLNCSGFKPRLDACVNCQYRIGTQDTLAKFSPILGGILCSRCFAQDRRAKTVLRGTLATIDYIESSSWPKALQLKMTRKIADELLEILSKFLDIHLDKEIKSRKFLN